MKRGSITVTLSLTLLVLLALLAVCLRSARIAAARVTMASAAEQGLYSLFACYDRELFNRYGLLFFDAGYGGGQLDMGRALAEIEETAGLICRPNAGKWFAAGRDILGIEPAGGSVLGYTLATDDGGAAFREQVCATMRRDLGAAGIAALRERLDTEEGLVRSLQDIRSGYCEEDAELYYEQDKTAGLVDEGEVKEAPEDFEDPIAAVDGIRKMGLLRVAVPASGSVSGAEIDLADTVGRRELQQGMGLIESTEPGFDDRLLLQEYLLRFYPSYTDGGGGGGLQYQVEYAFGGNDSDAANLRSVITALLGVREASNMVFLMRDEAKRARADSVAAIVSWILLMPELRPLFSFLIKLAWAYGESIMDVRRLLSGGRVPLVKTAETWQLKLSSVASAIFGFSPSDLSTQERGLAYEEYLRILLLGKNSEELTCSLMDLTEMNLRATEGGADFRLDACLASIEVELRAEVAGREWTVTRSYSY